MKKNKFKKWLSKSIFSISLSQLGLIILLVFVGPIQRVSLGENLLKYLLQGSVLLSVMSLSADLIAKFFNDERSDHVPLLFENNKKELIALIILLTSSGILYGLLPEENMNYTIFLQILFYIITFIMACRINYLVIEKQESYSKIQDEKGEEVSKKAKKTVKSNGVKFE